MVVYFGILIIMYKFVLLFIEFILNDNLVMFMKIMLVGEDLVVNMVILVVWCYIIY